MKVYLSIVSVKAIKVIYTDIKIVKDFNELDFIAQYTNKLSSEGFTIDILEHGKNSLQVLVYPIHYAPDPSNSYIDIIHWKEL